MNKTKLPLFETDLDEFDLSFKVFHDLMARKVSDILLVSSPYDAFIMEEEGRLAERIIHEYRGLNLSRPPRLTWASSTGEAFEILERERFDMVLTMPLIDGMDRFFFCDELKKKFPDIFLFLLLHRTGRHILEKEAGKLDAIDKIWIWNGNADLLLAIIKNLEDSLNVDFDTKRAMVRVIIFVEDSPIHYSSILPILYKEIVSQTQAVMEESINDEHRILRMRARPKILLAHNFEDAKNLYERFKPYVIAVISDVSFPREGKMDDEAGFELLTLIRKENPDLALLNLSSDPGNEKRAAMIPAEFFHKSSPFLHNEIRRFFVNQLGFGDFIFRMPDGTEIARASTLKEMEELLPTIPDESILYHALKNHFSTWLMARSEIMLATKLKPIKPCDFESMEDAKLFLADCIRQRRKGRQRGMITDFVRGRFDKDADFVKIGKGSLGGKARGLAFFSQRLKQDYRLYADFPDITITVPRTLVISTDGFDAFIEKNRLDYLYREYTDDLQVKERFLSAQLPGWLEENLALFIKNSSQPLAVRSSSLLEDAQFQPFAGIYTTLMLPNDDPDTKKRLQQLLMAIKLVYASVFLEAPRLFSRNTAHRLEEEKMAVLIQEVVGARTRDLFMPAISGVAQSLNYYPAFGAGPEDGIAMIAMGMGKTVVEGGTALRFSPARPGILTGFTTPDEALKNSQKYCYALRMNRFPEYFGFPEKGEDSDTLVKILVDELCSTECDINISSLFSTYVPDENRIRDTVALPGIRVLTFANILKHRMFPLPEIITRLLALGRKGMGCHVEIEFAVHLPVGKNERPVFSPLQIRPMSLYYPMSDSSISESDRKRAFCYSKMALGNGRIDEISDIILVKPETFDPAKTKAIAGEIGEINRRMAETNRPYLLVGPGRWGSSDHWLGIPVTWRDISGVRAIIEAAADNLKAEPSQGSHFFHNIVSMGIFYITATDRTKSLIRWDMLKKIPVERETEHVALLHADSPILIKVDGKRSEGAVIL